MKSFAFKEFDHVKLIPKFENPRIYIVAETKMIKDEEIVSMFPLSGGILVSAAATNLQLSTM